MLSVGISNATTISDLGFFQSDPPFGTDLPINEDFIIFNPTLTYDSFVTIGDLSQTAANPSDVVTDPSWDSGAFHGTPGQIIGGWFDSNLGTPVHPDANGLVAIAQLTFFAAGDGDAGVLGVFTAFYNDPQGNTIGDELGWPIPGPASVAILCVAGLATPRRRRSD